MSAGFPGRKIPLRIPVVSLLIVFLVFCGLGIVLYISISSALKTPLSEQNLENSAKGNRVTGAFTRSTDLVVDNVKQFLTNPVIKTKPHEYKKTPAFVNKSTASQQNYYKDAHEN